MNNVFLKEKINVIFHFFLFRRFSRLSKSGSVESLEEEACGSVR